MWKHYIKKWTETILTNEAAAQLIPLEFRHRDDLWALHKCSEETQLAADCGEIFIFGFFDSIMHDFI